jgi:signal transduction histidine kinase
VTLVTTRAGAELERVPLDDARLAARSQAAIAITSEVSSDRVLQRIADIARELIGARYAALGVADGHGRILQFLTSGLTAEERLAIGPLPRGRGLLGVLIHEGRPLRVPHIARDPRSSGFPPGHPPMTALLGVPIVARGEVLGDLYFTDRLDGRPFDQRDEQLAILLAGHAAVAIQNARLHDQLRELALHRERSRIMRDLHDGIIQSLFAIGLTIQDTAHSLDLDPAEARARLDKSVVDLDQVMADIRRYILDLERQRPPARGDLEARLTRLVDEFQAGTAMQIQLSVAPALADAALSEQTVEHLVQVAREALANAVKHAQADACAVRLERTRTRLVLTVWDNGVGFSPTARRSLRQRGLRNIRARARELGGTLRITSQPDQGTRILVTIPASESQVQGPNSEEEAP